MEGNSGVAHSTPDKLTRTLHRIAEGILAVVFGFLPLLFIPLASAPLEYTKVVAVVCGLALSAIFYSFSVLRSGTVSWHFPKAMLVFWLTVIAAGISAFLSGDVRDALIGNVMNVHTAVFLVVLAFTMTAWTLFSVRKETVVRLYMFFMISTIILVAYHTLRILFGIDFLSFGIFTSAVSTPIGSWNDLALFLALTVLIALVTLEQLPLTKAGKIVLGVVVTLALLMLAIINFSFVWIVLGVVTLVMIVYTLGKDRFAEGETSPFTTLRLQPARAKSLFLTIPVFAISVLFVLAGSGIGSFIGKYVDISYIEVRPSISATIDIMGDVYKEQAVFGIGTNRFADAWREHKNPAINSTLFWNTEFQAGSGYVPTLFVTTGVVGGVLFLLFLGLFLWNGIRTLLRAEGGDALWYFVATSSFVAATFIWGMAIFYVPGVTMLLIAALCTGISLLANHELDAGASRTMTLAMGRRTGFILTLAVIVVIVGSVASMYGAGRYFTALYHFNNSAVLASEGADIGTIEAELVRAYSLAQNDVFARRLAEYQIGRMNALLSVAQPTAAQQQDFQSAMANGIEATRIAVEHDATDPENWATSGRLYYILAAVGIEGAAQLSEESFLKAKELDASNPLRSFELAQLAVVQGNADAARTRAEEAIALKNNYTDVLFFLAQLDIANGNTANAVNTVRAIVSLEPQNPARYYQLGVLEMSRNEYQSAVSALESAVTLDSDYANARYYLALAYNQLGRIDEAKAQLERVLALNPGNTLVIDLLTEIEQNGRISINVPDTTVSEGESVTAEGDEVTATEDPDSPLLTPVNTAPSGNEGADAPAE